MMVMVTSPLLSTEHLTPPTMVGPDWDAAARQGSNCLIAAMITVMRTYWSDIMQAKFAGVQTIQHEYSQLRQKLFTLWSAVTKRSQANPFSHRLTPWLSWPIQFPSSIKYLHSSAVRGENGKPASAQNCACSDLRKASISVWQVNSLRVSTAVFPQLIRSPSLLSSSSWHCRL